MKSDARGNFRPDWQQLQDSIERPVGDPPPAVGRGIGYFYEGNYARAIEQFDAALAQDPQCISAISNRGAVHLHNREYQAALADFSHLIELAPGNSDAHYKRARTYAQMGHREQAMEDFRLALELAPADQAKRKQIDAQMERLRRTRTTTSAGIVLLAFSVVLALLSIKFAAPTYGLTDAIGPVLIFGVIAAAGAATVRRWRGWRIWAGAVAWILIWASVYMLPRAILSLGSPFAGDVGAGKFMVFLTVPLIAIGGFVLWAKRQEPRPARSGRRGEVTAAGATLLLFAGAILIALFVESLRGIAKTSDAVAPLAIAGLIGWAGAAMVFRSSGWRTLTGIVSWLALIVCVIEPLSRHRPGLPFGYFLASPDVMGAVVIGGIFVFILWAKRQEPKPKAALHAAGAIAESES